MDRLAAFLFVLVVGLAGVVVAQWRLDLSAHAPITPRIVTQADALAPPIPSSMEVPALVDLTDTVDRPVFSASRRPAQASSEPVQDEPQLIPSASEPPPGVRLSAVVIDDGRRFALLQRIPAAATVRLEQGESVDGWMLVEVRTDGVTLEKNGRRHEIALRTFEPAPASPARVPARPEQRESPGQASPAREVMPPRQPRRPMRVPIRPVPEPGRSG